jgi:hypothetical protein
MTTAEKKPRGRPRRYVGDRPNWTIRLEETYGEQVRQIAEESGRSISDVCSERIVNSFRLETICDLLEKKEKTLTAELRDARFAFRAALKRAMTAEKQIAELTKRLDQIMRFGAPRSRFGRPLRDK